MAVDEKQVPKKLLLETALLAGKIMTESNSETYRVEDTMERILSYSNLYSTVAISYATGLYASLDDLNEANNRLVGIKRIQTRGSVLHKVSKVNTVSRQLSNGEITLAVAYLKLLKIDSESNPYPIHMRFIGVIGLGMCFAILFGGGVDEFIVTTFDAVFLSGLMYMTARYEISSPVENVFCTMMITLFAYAMQAWYFPNVSLGIVIVSTLMPLVPGTAITNSLRDIFHEDYLAGGARAMEAFFQALMIALGSLIALIIIGRIRG
ncbi:threonine/serine exporter family protein [Aerococcus sanguinicola]|uniref:threonine/serine ThrE exporter family protein n=1 Tax=unclassified Aerococcus TaxID=2618060 RepID=UPI0008A2472C|nr:MULTISPECIES: threonine/serine exporter family protein [unclassified Aerococcus]KAB0646725.1 threonine/serine exporter family protein [Aerococcus sanguinicola]MDK6233873.1 threonine/serine exporter family protein [Aerococcus sp. UMB10185]MDK6805679.1 threonine/serine exporter family protein [Aerococcus sp. UMB7834]MDK6856296.1 threonine/serine exporter family protein [Aerococcus sp. UMB7533]MDK8502737.1 threonine/serine exporter family protein [Aerococcus sp. UMB1112A]